jgi:sugar lactone lactonase YvrE
MDLRLHADRLVNPRTQRTYRHPASDLPDGAFVEMEGSAWLAWKGALLRWSPQGYGTRRARPDGVITVLTPRCLVDVLNAGYGARVHDSAE